MKTINDNPRLNESLRQSYRSGKGSPYLAQRVIATIESNNQPSIPWLKFAGGLLSIAIVVLVFHSFDDTDTTDEPMVASGISVSLDLSAIATPAFSDIDIDVPSFSSLSNVPAINSFHTPARFLYNPGDFCIYQQTGEMSC